MDAQLQDEVFHDFGDDRLLPVERKTGLRRIDGIEMAQLRSETRRHLPKSPGCYGMLDPLGRLIYVGKSKSLRSRLLSYFSANAEQDKAGRIIESASAIVWETQPTEFAALVREQYLIRHFQPRYNVQGLPKRQQPIFICLGRSPEQLYTARRRDPQARFCLGPLQGAARASHAVEVLNRIYGLRDCSSKQPCSFSDQLELFEIEKRPGCIRLEINTCLGPCISACSRTEYEQHVRKAESFLMGQDTSPLVDLTARMHHASENLHFESAARLREDLRSVTWLSRRAADISNARDRYTFVYAPKVYRGRADSKHAPSDSDFRNPALQPVWYLIRQGAIEGSVAAPANQSEQRRTRELLKAWHAGENIVGHSFKRRSETLALVASWFRQHRVELKCTFVPGISRAPRSLTKKATKRTQRVKV